MEQAGAIGADFDVQRFERTLREHDGRLRALAFRMLGDAAAMDDVLQEAYLKAWRGLGSFRGEAQIGTWLYRIVTTTCIDHLRRRARQGENPMDDPEVSALPLVPPDTVGRLELTDALAQLHPDHRAVVLLVDVDGFSYDEAAAMLDIAPGTVGSRLNRAHHSLRLMLAEAP